MAQVTPYKAVIMSKAILSWQTAFFSRRISGFRRDRLSLTACWVRVVRASMFTLMSSRLVEGTKTVAKGLFPWKTEHVYPVTGHGSGSRNLRSKRQIFSRNLNGKVDLFYKNCTCGLILRCSCGCHFRITSLWYMLIHAGQRRQHCRV